jgi:hypothetical protein
MSNVFGEPLDTDIQSQIEIRQKVYGSGYISSRSSDQLVYLNSNTSWCKLVSSVDVNGNNELAKKFVLFNGTASPLSINPQDSLSLRGGVSFINDDIASNKAYGIGGNEFGINPMMGIISATINYENRGSIRKADIKIKAFNKNQFNIIDALYLRLGFTMLLEWGHSMYFLKDEIGNEILLKTSTTLTEDFLEGKFSPSEILQYIDFYKTNRYQGNYDAMLGRVSNFDYSFNKDGSYDITLKLISIGDVIESLQCNSYIPSTNRLSLDSNDVREINSAAALTIRAFESSNTIGLFLSKGVPKVVDATELKDYTPYIESGTSSPLGFTGPKPLFTSKKIDKNKFEDIKQKIKKDIEQNYIKEISKQTGTSNDISLNLNIINPLDKNVFKRSSEQFLFEQNQTTSVSRYGVFTRVTYTSDIGEQYYVRLGDFIDFLQSGEGGRGFIIPKVYYKGDTSGEPLIRFDTSVINNLMYVDPVQICTDPSICFTRRRIQIDNKSEEFVDEFGVCSEFIYEKSKGSIMDIYVNSIFIIDAIKNNTNYIGNISIFEALKKILDGINKSLGGINNLDIFIDENSNIATIIDKNPYPYKKGKPTIFKVLGYDNDGTSFVKSFNLKTELPPSLSIITTVGAQQNGIVVGENATALSRLNRGTKDRYQNKISNESLSNPTSPTLPIDPLNPDFVPPEEANSNAQQNSNNVADEYAKFTKEAWGRYKNFLLKLKNKDASHSDVDSFSGQLKDLLTITTTINEQTNLPKTCALFTGFLPFNLSLDIDGLSGMKINQTILVDTDYLPKNYPKHVNFLIKNIQHTIEGNKWTTKLESFAISSTSEANVQEETISSRYLNNPSVKSQYERFSFTSYVNELLDTSGTKQDSESSRLVLNPDCPREKWITNSNDPLTFKTPAELRLLGTPIGDLYSWVWGPYRDPNEPGVNYATFCGTGYMISLISGFSDITKDKNFIPDENGVKYTQEKQNKYYEYVLKEIGAPITSGNLLWFRAWRLAEGGTAKNNAFNSTQVTPNQRYTIYNSVGVKNYLESWEQGAKANASTMLNGLYPTILKALRAGISDKAEAIELAKLTQHYIMRNIPLKWK